MKIKNLILGIALADRAVNDQRQQDLMALADYIITHPTSRVFYDHALYELGIAAENVPGELWGDSVADESIGSAGLKNAITNLNQQWQGGKLNRLVAVRNLAWHAQLLARRLEKDCEEGAEAMVKRNGGSTANLLHGFVRTGQVSRAELTAIFAPPAAPPTTGEPT